MGWHQAFAGPRPDDDKVAPIAVIRMCAIEPLHSTLNEVRADLARCENQPFIHRLLDQLVGLRQQQLRHGKAECFGRLEVDGKPKESRPLERQIRWFRAL